MNAGNNTIRIAYLLTVHKNPAQVGRLVKRLYNPGCQFFIHVSANAPWIDFQRAVQQAEVPASAVHFNSKRIRVRWGDFSLVTATLNGLVDVLNSRFEPDFIVMLSGQDYPLTTNDKVLAFLEKNITRNFVPCHDISMAGSEHLVERLHTYRIPVTDSKTIIYPNKAPDSVKKKVLDQALRFSRLLPINRPVPLAYTPYFGSNWLRIKPDAARYLLTFLRKHPAFLTYFRYVLVPEEYIYQTILGNTPDDSLRETLCNDNFTYTHWDRPPELYSVPLNMSDSAALINSGKLFARKFDMTHDTSLLDWLDRQAGVHPGEEKRNT